MTPRPVLFAVLVGVVLVVAVVGLRALQGDTPAARPSPIQTAPSATPSPQTASPTATSSPTASPDPSPTPSGPYVSATMGFSMALPPPWHRVACGSSSSGPIEDRDGVELFVPIPDLELELGDVGGPNTDNIQVLARSNPEGLTPRQWEESGRIGESIRRVIEDVTFAGRPALLVRERHLEGWVVDEIELYVVANGSYMYEVGHTAVTQVTTAAQRQAILRTVRFLTLDEARAARASPTPSPTPRSPEQVADTLAEGFARRDVPLLASVITPRCFNEGVAQGGATARTGEASLEMLRDRFARGLAVEVRPRPIEGEPQYTMTIRSTWREPGQPDRDVDLMIVVEGSTAYWNGTITWHIPRP